MEKVLGAVMLENLLNFWENLCFMQKISNVLNLARHGTYLTRPIKTADFRKYVLQYKGGPFDFDRFIADETKSTSLIPLGILGWNHDSRRIFHLAADSQTLLDSTSLGGIKWGDIKFPFDSFLVTLEDPLVSGEGKEYTGILITKIDQLHPGKHGVMLELRLLDKSFENYETISHSSKKKMEACLNNKNFTELVGLIKSTKQSLNCSTQAIYIFKDQLDGLTIRESIPKLGALTSQPDMAKDSSMDSAIHIVLNLCLYLENYPSKILTRKEKPTKKKIRSEFDISAIVKEEDIFKIQCHFNMSPQQVAQLVRTENELLSDRKQSSFWRRAHWRRKPFCGHIPMQIAPKDWIPRKLVNARLLPENSLPTGSNATIKR